MRLIKFQILVPIIEGIIILILFLLLFFNYRNSYKQDMISLFGENKYLVESIQENHVKLYSLNNKNEDGFASLSVYMKKRGYSYCPDKRLGTLHCFRNKNGDHAECEANYFNNYIEWDIYFPT